jgi:hypothetical protein
MQLTRRQQPLRQVSGVVNLHACCHPDAQQHFKPLTLCPQVTRMGLFGLGVPELALVAGAAALLFGELHACADMIWIFAG